MDIEKEKIQIKKSLLLMVMKGGAWIFFLRIVQVALQGIKLIILARVLRVEDFGIIGIALLTTAILETFSKTGFEAALIQKISDIKSFLNSAWTILIIRSFVLFVILYAIAPYVENFFECQNATWIIRAMGLSIILNSCVNIGVIYFQKEIKFNKEFYYQFSGAAIDFVITISLLILWQNIWAFVLGYLSGYFTRCILSYFIHPYRPRFELQFKKIKELFHFGKWVLGSSILIFLGTQGDDILVGRIMGASMLGLYQMAYKISNMPATEITHVISKVSFPAYSKMQDNIVRLRESFIRILDITTFLSFPLGALICVFAFDFTKIFMGEKWLPIVPVIQILAAYGVLRSIDAAFGSVFQALGKPSIITKVSFYYVLFLVCIIYPLMRLWGLVGVSIAVTLAGALTFGFCLEAASRIFRKSFLVFVKVMYPHAIMTLVMIALVFACKFILGNKVAYFAQVLISATIAAGAYFLYGKKIIYSIMEDFKKQKI